MDQSIEIFRGMCNTWECDENGHLNVRYYVAKIGEGLSTFWHELGLTGTVRSDLGAEPVITDMHLRFLREVHPGWGLIGRAGILETGADWVRVYAELLNGHTDDVSATFNMIVNLRDEKTGAPVDLPTAFVDAARQHMVDLPKHGAPRSIDLTASSIIETAPPTLTSTADIGLFDIQRGVVNQIEVDAKGRMLPEYYIGRISDGVVHLTRRFRPKDTKKERSLSKYGGAVLEYRLLFHKPLHVGDIIVVRSGLKHVGEKANHMVHLTFDGETGELVASSEAIGITLDLEARKVVPLPEDRRAHLSTLVVPGLAA